MNDVATNELIVIEPANALTIFTSPNAVDPLLERIRSEIDAFKPDITTAGGRKAVASMAYKVARAKTYLDDAGKKLADQQKEIPKKIDATRKRIRDLLDEWKDEVRLPLTEWEAAEEARIAKHKSGVEWFSLRATENGNLDAAELRGTIADVEARQITEAWEEFASDAAFAKEKALTSLRAALAKREAYEAEQEELARLRAEAAAREQKEREERIAADAADKARRDAEAKADADRKAAEAAAQREREAAERRELELKLAAETAERRAAEAEAKAKRDAEAEVRRIADEAAKREADKAHRAKINGAALAAFVASGIDDATARAVITLIAQRSIPHISITY